MIKKRISALLVIWSFLFSPHLLFSQDANKSSSERIELDKKVAYLYNEFEKFLKKKSWHSIFENFELKVYRFGEDYSEFKIKIEPVIRSGIYMFNITIAFKGKIQYQEFKFNKKDSISNIDIKKVIFPFLISQFTFLDAQKSVGQVYFSTLSMGYNRTHDNHEFYPQYKQGSFYMAGSLVYDPAVNIKSKEISLRIADYLSVDLYYAYDSHIRESGFNIDFFVYGGNKYEKKDGKERRLLYGFFTGCEYFRPGYYDTTLKWNRQVYKKQPHIQYTVWRALQYAMIKTDSLEDGILKLRLMASVGPSINSSLTATNVQGEDEEELSHIFKSIKHRKQNYYYGIAFPLSGSILLDKIYNFKLGAGYNFYFFYPVENENAYDFLNILKISIGYYLTDNCLFDAHYEFWDIKSKVRSVKKDHSWNRLILEIKYIF